jgi:cytochrome o ubiquinol oxidase subunit 2
MHFKFHGMSAADFEHWVQTVKAGGQTLDRDGYLQLERPSEREPVRRYATVAEGLYDSILSRTIASANLADANPVNANLPDAKLAGANPGARAP